MASINKVILVGNLGSDPEQRLLSSGRGIVTLSVASTEKRRPQGSHEYQSFTEWHKVELGEDLARAALQDLRKGQAVYIEGSLHHRQWTDQKTGKPRYATFIRAHAMQRLGPTSSRRHTGNNDSATHGDYHPS